jgi:hypothetical protein
MLLLVSDMTIETHQVVTLLKDFSVARNLLTPCNIHIINNKLFDVRLLPQ